MRRPSPLPPSVTTRGARSDPEPARLPAGPASGETAPVIPLAPGIPRPGASGSGAPHGDDAEARETDAAATGADAGAREGVLGAGPDGVRLRDVWRAARARRRVLRAEVRRFTARQRRRRATWIGVGAALVLLVLGTLGAAYGPLFAVDEITVVGTSQLDPDLVADALADQVGTPLPLVDPSEVKAALVGFPLVESYALEARPPHELVVRIVERTPVGVIASAAGYTLVDAAGVALSTTPDVPAGQPVIEAKGGVDGPAFAAIGVVMRSVPEAIRAQVTGASATTPNDVTLTLGGTDTQVVWGGADDSAMKALVLEKSMAARPPDTVDMYDISSPLAVVFR